MTKKLKMPYGSWPTPITSDLVVRSAATVSEVALDGEEVWWSESRPEEGGRIQLVRWRSGTGPVDALPERYNARTAAHEYGGGAWWVSDGHVRFVNWSDQVLYEFTMEDDGRLAYSDEGPDYGVFPMTLADPLYVRRGNRWADGDNGRGPSDEWLVVVRERHIDNGGPAEVLNEMVALSTANEEPAHVLVYGADFVSNPRFSPGGDRLCWLQWNHPDMPWDGTELYVAGWGGRREPTVLESGEVAWDLTDPAAVDPVRIAGRGSGGQQGDGESIFQPQWAEDGSLWFVSDRTGWWNLYRWDGESVEPMVELGADIGVPQWVFGQSRYAFLDGGRVVFAYLKDGMDHLAVRTPDGKVTELDLPYTQYEALQGSGDQVVFVGASPTAEATVIRIKLDGGKIVRQEVLRPSRTLGLDSEWFSVPESISFPTSGGRTAHALFYPPTNPEVAGPDGEKPPLMVLIHGGPTSAARPMLKLGTQYWTTRGFAVVDVNYGGSTGYGRAYRDQLRGNWGVVDVDDCEAAARWLAEQGRVDPDRLCIRGGSAGGYTTLAALALRDTFAAGASHYGIADLEAVATDTHKFESRYLDGLIGPYPEKRDVYVERSPIHHVEKIGKPLAVFQGLDDEIVPPNQTEMIVEALRKRAVPVAHQVFEGEQHGFRQAGNIRRALDGELSFYAQVFGFDLPPDEDIQPLPVENL